MVNAKAKADIPAILLVAFGTSAPEGRAALDHIEAKVKAAFPGVEVRWSYTSSMIRKKISREQQVFIDSPLTALAKLRDDGYNQVVVHSLHIFPGREYCDLEDIVRSLQAMKTSDGPVFDRLVLSDSLLHEFDDYRRACEAIAGLIPENSDEEALLLMGHGTDHRSLSVFGCLNDLLRHQYRGKNVMLATVEGYPKLQHALNDLAASGVKKVKVAPFLVVAGSHAQKDMAGDAPHSWKSRLEAKGYDVSLHMQGLGENDAIVEMMVDHLKKAWR
ncbi:cobalt chelatase cbik [Heliomicrobium modesticaldum Ice1]|uniref:Cobalt chelatase cbik n=1 Tax=Heliobacterium modesticaldum (strain ATCC 51547 / Ice1) TaxID=498761 RepID=B0TFY5_HELMI|nr:sirohydrochlorin cobaltochelatase [Heliomicrobium modesticaldum]ABZ83142.1 cobalt chelatase cbik [Heliomicrobium modesticaldum Ice1]